jgi:hypothetical protein
MTASSMENRNVPFVLRRPYTVISIAILAGMAAVGIIRKTSEWQEAVEQRKKSRSPR